MAPIFQTPLRYTRPLTIAGSDSGGGAGIQADLKTFAALGCYGMSAITAITAQNTLGVKAIHALPASLLLQQIDAVTEDIGVDAVKIGMLHDPEVVMTVAAAIRRHGWTRVVLDPVMVATSGDALIARETVAVLVRELFPLATVVTPNLDEAALLLDRPVTRESELEQAAAELLALGAPAMLLKGGHLAGEDLVDLLLETGRPAQRYTSTRIVSRNTHGTGCTLSSAIACYLALGHGLAEAVLLARTYVVEAIRYAADVQIGGGHGPLNHGFAPVALHKFGPRA